MPATASRVLGVGRRRVEPDTDTYAGRLAARIRTYRERAKKSVPELAELIDVAPATLYQYESGRREIPVAVVVAIAEALGKNPGDLFPPS